VKVPFYIQCLIYLYDYKFTINDYAFVLCMNIIMIIILEVMDKKLIQIILKSHI